MGHRNPDRVPLHWRRTRVETVAEMIAAGWDVISKCQVCGLTMQILRVIAIVSGSLTSLWNRNAPCRRLLCRGQVAFWGQGARNGQPRTADRRMAGWEGAAWPDASAMTESSPGVPLAHYRTHGNAGVRVTCRDCMLHRDLPLEGVISRLMERGVGDEQTGIIELAGLLRAPCRRCGGRRATTAPCWN